MFEMRKLTTWSYALHGSGVTWRIVGHSAKLYVSFKVRRKVFRIAFDERHTVRVEYDFLIYFGIFVISKKLFKIFTKK